MANGGIKEKQMKIIINTNYGHISEETAEHRLDPRLIEQIESGGFSGAKDNSSWGGVHESLMVVELPEDITDYKIVNYDGAEGILYVQDGQIHFKGCEESYRIFQ